MPAVPGSTLGSPSLAGLARPADHRLLLEPDQLLLPRHAPAPCDPRRHVGSDQPSRGRRLRHRCAPGCRSVAARRRRTAVAGAQRGSPALSWTQRDASWRDTPQLRATSPIERPSSTSMATSSRRTRCRAASNPRMASVTAERHVSACTSGQHAGDLVVHAHLVQHLPARGLVGVELRAEDRRGADQLLDAVRPRAVGGGRSSSGTVCPPQSDDVTGPWSTVIGRPRGIRFICRASCIAEPPTTRWHPSAG